MRPMHFMVAGATAALLSSHAGAGDMGNSCSVKSCDVGTKVVTYATKAEPYFACPTRELAEYTTIVLGLIATHVTLLGKMPNISDRTGEPEYQDGPDGQNQTKQLLDRARRAAGVKTFDQAASICELGRAKISAMVMNNPDGMRVLWVKDAAGKTFWMPKSHADIK